MNLPNQLTCLRVIATAIMVVLVEMDVPGKWWWALAIFLFASFTDYLDGAIARKYQLITSFGKLMDPLADKVLVCATFILLVADGAVGAWVPIILLTREFLVSGLRMEAAASGEVIAADWFGKIKTVVQMICLAYLLGIAAWSGVESFKSAPHFAISSILIGGVVVTTLGSGWSYLSHFLRQRKTGSSGSD